MIKKFGKVETSFKVDPYKFEYEISLQLNKHIEKLRKSKKLHNAKKSISEIMFFPHYMTSSRKHNCYIRTYLEFRK